MGAGLLIFGIVVLISAVLLVVKYEKIDNALFGSTSNDDCYISFGKRSVLASTVCGAVMTVGIVMKKVFELNWNVESAVFAGILLLIVVVSFNVYRSFAQMPTMQSAIGKALFLLFVSVVGAAVGAIGSLIIMGLIAIYLVLTVLAGAASGGGRTSSSSSSNSDSDHDATVTDEHGFERKLRENGGGYVDDKGDHWKRSGYNEVTRDE